MTCPDFDLNFRPVNKKMCQEAENAEYLGVKSKVIIDINTSRLKLFFV